MVYFCGMGEKKVIQGLGLRSLENLLYLYLVDAASKAAFTNIYQMVFPTLPQICHP